MKYIGLRVEDDLGDAFHRFCNEQGVSPYELLSSLVRFYARGQLLKEKANTLGQDEALMQLGDIVRDMKRFANANGEFAKAVSDLLEPHGVSLDMLWPSGSPAATKRD